MIAASIPFKSFWATRCFYELGSRSAPFVTYLDYDPNIPKAKQKWKYECAEGVTLGLIVDAIATLFALDGETRFVMIESLDGRAVTEQDKTGIS